MGELEALKPEFDRRVEELNNGFARTHLPQLDGPERIPYDSKSSSSELPSLNNIAYSSINVKRVLVNASLMRLLVIKSSSGIILVSFFFVGFLLTLLCYFKCCFMYF